MESLFVKLIKKHNVGSKILLAFRAFGRSLAFDFFLIIRIGKAHHFLFAFGTIIAPYFQNVAMDFINGIFCFLFCRARSTFNVEIIDILGDDADLAFLIHQLVADDINTDMAFVRLAFLLLDIKFL